MPRRIVELLLLFWLISLSSAVLAQTLTDAKDFPSCKYCGMDRQVFAHSRMLIEYEDGRSLGTCSITCAVEDLEHNKGKKVKSISVADYNSKNLIAAKSASWVLGGNKPGVMTRTAKWAFEKREDAQDFVSQSGGRIVTFDEIMKVTRQEGQSHDKKETSKKKSKKAAD